MRRINIKGVMLIVLIIGLSLGTLSYQKVNLNFLGVHFQRGGNTILGMRLGLDLQGGSSLVYQARGSKQISLTFQNAEVPPLDPAIARANAVNDTLTALGIQGATVVSSAEREAVITLPPSDQAATSTTQTITDTDQALTSTPADSIRPGLQTKFGPVATFIQSDAPNGGKQITVTFQNNLPTPGSVSREEQVRQVVRNFGKTSAQISPAGGNSYTIQVDTLNPAVLDASNNVNKIAEADAIKQAIEQSVGTLASYTVTDIAANPTAAQMQGVLSTIQRRINPFGISEPVIQLMGGNRVLVQLPGLTNPEEVKTLIGQTAQLDFKERHCVSNIPVTVGGITAYPCTLPGNYVDSETGLTGEDLSNAYPGTDPQTGQPIVNLQFNSRGTKIFADLTARLFATNSSPNPDRFAIFLDNVELLAPVVQQPILTGTGFINGADFTAQRVSTLSIQLNSGRLPVPLDLVQEQQVDATLGKDSLQKSLLAGGVGLALIALFLVLYYKASGVVASLALLVYSATVLAIFKLIPVTMTLAGIAGFILSLGMAVDANVLIFERMKEELRVGRTLASAIEIGFSRAWPAIRDSNVSTIMTSVILIWFGQRLGAAVLAGFGTTLVIGVVLSLFSSIFVSKMLLNLVAQSPFAQKRSWFTPEPLPSASARTEAASAIPTQERK